MNNMNFSVINELELNEINGGSRGSSIMSSIAACVGIGASVVAGSPVAVVAGCIYLGYHVTKAIKG